MLYAGCDWSDRWLDVAVLDRPGSVLGETRIIYADVPDRVARYKDFLAPLGRRWRGTITGIEDVGITVVRPKLNPGPEPQRGNGGPARLA